jgi:hypothetical protein
MNIDLREEKWGILNTIKVSYKHSESVYIVKLAMKYEYPLNTIEGIRIIVTLAIELSPKCQMKD